MEKNGSVAGVPRLCHVVKTPHFDGYGFNLHAEKSKPGQFIGKVDEGSPAEAAGLRQGDRILQVNGVDIANETHKQVVERIKQNPNETKLLVVAAEEGGAETVGEPQADENQTQTEAAMEPTTLKLNMTAAELRAQLANRKKYDPKKESIDFKKKFDIVQTL